MPFLDQSNRHLSVSVVGDDALTGKLVIERFQGSDYLSRDFHYEVLLLSEDDALSLADIQGRMMVVWLQLPDGTHRPFTGLVKYFEFIDKTMRGICSYRARMVPWTDYARLRRNCRIHRDTTREQQFKAVLDDYRPVADWQWRVGGTARSYTMCVQFNETDWNYLVYRLEFDGTPYCFEHHGSRPAGASPDDQPPGHTFVVVDTTTEAEPIGGPSPEVRFHPDHETSNAIQQHAITKWTRHAQWGHGLQTVSSYDFKAAKPASAHADTDPNTGPHTTEQADNVLAIDSHEFVGNYGFIDPADGDRLARLRMEESDVRRRQMFGHGTNPYLQVGRWFELTEHPDCASDLSNNQYVVSEIHYDAKNNFLNDQEQAPSFRNTFLCHPRHVPWRPGRGLASTRHIVTQVQTATIVGDQHGGAVGEVDVDSYGRPMVRFHWDLDGTQTCRVRLQQPWAGGEKGFAFYPRIGSEVVVAFEMGNPDSPIIQGAVSNAARRPPWKLPSQSHLSGIRTRANHEGGGNRPGSDGNHLLLDDTPGKLQWQAFSAQHYSQLSLGAVAFTDGTAGRTRARGQGFELRTDGHGSERAARGIFKTTDGRADAASHATDIREAAERLANAQDLHGTLSDVARAAGAHDANDQAPVVKALQQQIAELKGSGGNREAGQFPEFSAPHILTASAAGVETVAEGSTHMSSNAHTAFTSGGHTSISAGRSLLASVRESVRLFAYKAGIRMVSAGADIDIRALKTSVNILAKLNITQTADSIDINARTRLSLSGGGSNITLTSGRILQKTSGQWLVHAANTTLQGPSAVGAPALPESMTLPPGNVDVRRRYVSELAAWTPHGIQAAPVSLIDADTGAHAATLDASGFTSIASVPIGTGAVTCKPDPKDPWDGGSYLGEWSWPDEAGQSGSPRPPASPDARPGGSIGAASLARRQADDVRAREAPPSRSTNALVMTATDQEAQRTVVLDLLSGQGQLDRSRIASAAASMATGRVVAAAGAANASSPSTVDKALHVAFPDLAPSTPARQLT